MSELMPMSCSFQRTSGKKEQEGRKKVREDRIGKKEKKESKERSEGRRKEEEKKEGRKEEKKGEIKKKGKDEEREGGKKRQRTGYHLSEYVKSFKKF